MSYVIVRQAGCGPAAPWRATASMSRSSRAPAPDELADRYGDAAGLGVHLYPESVRYLWLDRAQRQAGKDKPPRGRELPPG